MTPTIRTCPSYPISIFMAGALAKAEACCQEYCDQWPYCVTVTPTRYVYTDGNEAGFIVGLINYPRFPSSAAEIWQKAEEIADYLVHRLGQQSYTIQSPDRTAWFSYRGQGNPSTPTPHKERSE